MRTTVSPALGWPKRARLGMISAIQNKIRGRDVEAVLFVFFLLAFALVAPPHVVAITATGLLLASVLAQAMAARLSGVKVGIAPAFRTLVLGFLASMLLSFAIMGVAPGRPPAFEHALVNPGAHVLAYGVCVLGFRLVLRLSWAHAAIVAAMCSLTIGLSIWLAFSLGAQPIKWP